MRSSGRSSGSQERTSLADEARYLAVLLAALLDDAEACGLASLISLAASRAAAREVDGVFVPLEDQDVTRWDAGLIADGERLLQQATKIRDRANEPIGRFQLEAAIQAAHAARRRTGNVDWRGVLQLTESTRPARANARCTGRARGRTARRCTARMPESPSSIGIQDPQIDRFQPAWATRAQLLADAGSPHDAALAYQRAISLTTEPAIRRFLQQRLSAVAPG